MFATLLRPRVFGIETSLARLGRIATTERHVPAWARDDDELLSLRATILARLLDGGIGRLVSGDEDGIAGSGDADPISSRLDLFYFSDIRRGAARQDEPDPHG